MKEKRCGEKSDTAAGLLWPSPQLPAIVLSLRQKGADLEKFPLLQQGRSRWVLVRLCCDSVGDVGEVMQRFFFIFLQKSARRWERSFPQPSRRASCWLVTPRCSAEPSPFLRAGASRAADLGSSGGAEQRLLCFVPNPGGWILAVGLPNAAARGPAGPSRSASRGCALSGFFFFPSCTIFRRRWTALAQLQRQSSPCQEARCMVTLPASPWQGWESFSRCERAACGSRRLGAGCLRGAARAALRSPRLGTAATNQTPGGGSSPAMSSPGFNWSKEAAGWRGFSPVLLPPPSPSLPPPQQCCGESGDWQSADCSDRWQVISPRANLTPQKKIGLGVIQLLGLKARACRDSVLL